MSLINTPKKVVELVAVKQKPQKKEPSTTETNDFAQSPIYSSLDIKNMEFDCLPITGMFAHSIGDEIELPFDLMIYGAQGGGKSRYSIQLAKYFATKGLKVCYIAQEESRRDGRLSKKFKSKQDMYKAYHSNLEVLPSFNIALEFLPLYKIVIIDSITTVKGFTPEYFEQLKQKYPQISFIMVFQGTKDGKFRGSAEWGFNVDVVLRVDKEKNDPTSSYCYTEKSRFLGKESTMKVKI